MTVIGGPALLTGRLPRPVAKASDLMRYRVLVDLATAWATWAVVLTIGADATDTPAGLVASLAALATTATTAAARGYSRGLGVGRVLEHRQLLRAVITTGVVALIVDQLTNLGIGSTTVAVATAAGALTTQAGRAIVDRREDQLRRRGRLSDRVLVISDGEATNDLLDLIEGHPDTGWHVVACAGHCGAEAAARGVDHLGTSRHVVNQVERSRASVVVVSAELLRDEWLHTELLMVRRDGIDVHVHAGLRGFDHRGVRVAPIGHDTVLCLEQARLIGCQRFVKRSLDITIAAITLLIVAPILALTALAVKLQDGGPVLFRQRRVGRGGTTFMMPKFRSMGVDAEERVAELQHLNERDDVLFKIDDDPRVTRVGRVIRALSLDEFPQLVSVLRGDMSLIGPRPALPTEVEKFDARLALRHDVRPGVTGMWQVEARDNESFDAYRRLDLFYVENWSLLLDFTILVHTVPTVIERGFRALRRTSVDQPASTDIPFAQQEIPSSDSLTNELMVS